MQVLLQVLNILAMYALFATILYHSVIRRTLHKRYKDDSVIPLPVLNVVGTFVLFLAILRTIGLIMGDNPPVEITSLRFWASIALLSIWLLTALAHVLIRNTSESTEAKIAQEVVPPRTRLGYAITSSVFLGLVIIQCVITIIMYELHVVR